MERVGEAPVSPGLYAILGKCQLRLFLDGFRLLGDLIPPIAISRVEIGIGSLVVYQASAPRAEDW